MRFTCYMKNKIKHQKSHFLSQLNFLKTNNFDQEFKKLHARFTMVNLQKITSWRYLCFIWTKRWVLFFIDSLHKSTNYRETGIENDLFSEKKQDSLNTVTVVIWETLQMKGLLEPCHHSKVFLTIFCVKESLFYFGNTASFYS